MNIIFVYSSSVCFFHLSLISSALLSPYHFCQVCTTSVLYCAHLWLQQNVNCELPDVQAGFTKGRGIRDQIANTHWITEKVREFLKNIYFCFFDNTKALTMWNKTNCRKFLKRCGYQITGPASWEICMQVRKQQLELDMEQQTGSR